MLRILGISFSHEIEEKTNLQYENLSEWIAWGYHMGSGFVNFEGLGVGFISLIFLTIKPDPVYPLLTIKNVCSSVCFLLYSSRLNNASKEETL